MKIGHTLKIVRIAKHLRQKELSNSLGVTANYLSMVENDRRDPSLTFLKNFSRELEVPLGYLLWLALGDESPSPDEISLKKEMDKLLVELLQNSSNMENKVE